MPGGAFTAKMNYVQDWISSCKLIEGRYLNFAGWKEHNLFIEAEVKTQVLVVKVACMEIGEVILLGKWMGTCVMIQGITSWSNG